MNQAVTQSHPFLGATIRVPDDVVYREFASETVVLNLKTGKYHGLNPTAAEMLVALDKTGSIEAAAGEIAERHGIEPAKVQRDICILCERFSERGLISVEPGTAD